MPLLLLLEILLSRLLARESLAGREGLSGGLSANMHWRHHRTSADCLSVPPRRAVCDSFQLRRRSLCHRAHLRYLSGRSSCSIRWSGRLAYLHCSHRLHHTGFFRRRDTSQLYARCFLLLPTNLSQAWCLISFLLLALISALYVYYSTFFMYCKGKASE